MSLLHWNFHILHPFCLSGAVAFLAGKQLAARFFFFAPILSCSYRVSKHLKLGHMRGAVIVWSPDNVAAPWRRIQPSELKNKLTAHTNSCAWQLTGVVEQCPAVRIALARSQAIAATGTGPLTKDAFIIDARIRVHTADYTETLGIKTSILLTQFRLTHDVKRSMQHTNTEERDWCHGKGIYREWLFVSFDKTSLYDTTSRSLF